MSSDDEWENDPDGSNIKVAVIMVGEVYRTAGLKSSEFVEVEGELYDQLCSRKNNAASRDEVRKIAQSISNSKNVKMDVSVEWLDGFMRRFCLSNKKPSNYGKNLIKVKGRRAQAMIKSKKRGNEEVSPKSDSNIDGESNKSKAVNEKPVKNTSEPIEIADKPVEIADKPIEIAEKPVEIADKPVEIADKPVESVDDSVKLTDEIVDVSNEMEADEESPSPVNSKNKHNSSDSKSDKSKSNNKTPNKDTSNTKDNVINASHEENSISSITNFETEEPSSINEAEADVKQESGVSIGNVIANQTITLDTDSEEDIPPNKVNNPTSEVNNSTSEVNVPTSEVEAPTPEVEAKPSPVKVIRLRPMAELMSSFTADEPVVESRPATNGVPVKSTLMLLHRNVKNDDGRSVKPVKVDRKVVPIEPPKKTTQNVHSDEEDSNMEENNEDAIDKTEEEEEEEESEEAVEEIVTSESSVEEVSSSNENSSDNADFYEAATKKWEAENEVKYSRKEDKAYGKSSDEYVVKLDGLLKCTSCQGQVNHRMTSLVFTHPALGVLLCKRCRKSYGSGKFKQDSDGLDEFCRWCANGGDLLICDHCPNGFCRSCIRRNLGRSELSSVDSTMRKNKEWSCYVCDQSPLIELRLTHRAVIENLKNSAKADATKSRSEKKQSTIADKFSLLKNQRKEKLSKESPTKSTEEAKSSKTEKSTNLEPQSDDNVSDHYPWVSKCIQDFSEMLDICVHQVSRVKEKWEKNCLKNERETRLQSSRRVLRLMRAMGDNFKSLETKFLESCGDDREDLVAALGGVLENDSEKIDSNELKKDETDSDTKAVVSRNKKESKASESKKTKNEEPDQEMEDNEAPENGCVDNGSDVEQEQEVTPKKKSGSRRRTDESPKNSPSESSIRRSTRAKATFAVAEDSDEDLSNRRRSSRSIQKPNSYLEPNAPKPKKRKRSQSDPESEEEVKSSTRTSKRSNVRTNKESEEEKSDHQESSNEKTDSKRKRSSKNDKKADKEEDVENESDDEANEDVDDEDSKSVTKAKKSTRSSDKSVSNGKKSDIECDEASDDADEDNEESNENVKKSEEDKEENSSEIKDDLHSEETTGNKEKSSDKKSASRKSKRKNNSTNNDSETGDTDIAATEKKSNSTSNGDKKTTKKVGSDNEKDAFDKMNDGDSSNGECDVGLGDDNLYDSDQHNDVEHTEESADKVEEKGDKEAEAHSDEDSEKKNRTSGKEGTPEKDDSGKRTSKRKKRESTVKNVDDEKANEADSESDDLEKTPSKVNKKKTKRSPRTTARTSNRNSTQDPSESESDEEKEKALSSKSRKSDKKSSKKSSSPSKRSKNDKEMDSDEFEKKKRAYLKRQKEKEKVAEDGFSDNDSNDSDRMKLMQDITKICDMPMEEGEEDFDKIIAKAVDEQNDVKSEGSDAEKSETSDTKETKPKKNEDSDSVDDNKKSTKSEIKKVKQKVDKAESQSEEESTKVKGTDEEEDIKKSSDGEKEVHMSSKKTKEGEKKSKQDNDKAKKMCLDSDSSDVELPSVKKSKVNSKKDDTNDNEDKEKKESSKSSKSKKKYKSSTTNDSDDKKKDVEESSEKKGSSAKSDEEDTSLTSEKKASVDVLKLPSLIMDKIKENSDSIMVSECEDFIMADENLRTKLAMANDSSDEDGNKSSEDSEFDNLFKFKERKHKSSKKTVKSNETDGEKEEENKESDENKEADDDKGEDDDKDKIKKSKKKREKKEGLLDISLKSEGEGDSSEGIASDGEVKGKLRKAEPISLNDKIKKSLLASSDEEENEEAKSEEEDISTKMERDLIEEDRKKKYEKMMERKKKKEAEKEDKEDSDEEEGQKRKKGYMSLKFSSDEENADKEESEATDGSDLETPRKSRMFIGSDSDSDFEMPTKSSKRKKKSSDSDESEEDTKSKKKRRIKMASSSSDEEEGKKDKEDTPSKRKMRKIIRDEDLNESTITATQAEEQRIKRLKDRQQLYNKIFEVDVENDQTSLTSLVLDFDPETKEELVSVDPKLVAFLKPHQTEGIKFMWDATCESVERVNEEKGSGAILAHCMGLGKTLQVIVFVHTLLNCRKLNQKMNKVLVLCPVNTVYNWVAEFKNWLKKKMLTFEVTELISAKDLWNRAYRLDEWHKESGVVIMGYDMYRTLCGDKNKKIKGRMKEIFQRTLVNPGPDLVICDEGHILKNEKTALALAVNKMNTARRVVLTGTPLQNNLSEYHCMIQFVKPNLLGTRKEFMNRFVNPIQAGGSADATPRDVKRMKRRAHILHDLLSGCVQRFDYSVLQPFLPPKMEYVISVQMSSLQKKLYYYYLENLSQKGTKKLGSGLFVDFNCLGRVWTHPKILGLHSQRAAFDDDEEELDDFVCDDTTSESSDDERPSKKKKKNGKGSSSEDVDASKPPSPEEPARVEGLTASGSVKHDWWRKTVAEDVDLDMDDEDNWLNKIELSGKLTLLLDILRECSSIGDKVLLFSQSILALDMIEEFLHLIDKGQLEMPSHADSLPLQYKYWKRERDYLRLDGQVSAEIRQNQCKHFNDPKNERCRLFLISTRAGGIGINLVAANRVIIFDSSWNPAHDTQSIYRVYRFGQKKPVYVYRFVAQGTMEEKIYSRQVNKISTSLRVVDEHQIKRYFNSTDLDELYEFNPADEDTRETPIVPEDRLLAELIIRHSKWIVGYHEHDSLLENQEHEELTEEERKAAWEDFENEKKGLVSGFDGGRMNAGAHGMNIRIPQVAENVPPFDFNMVYKSIYEQNPHLPPAQLQEQLLLATRQIQKIHLTQYQQLQSYIYNIRNPMLAPHLQAEMNIKDVLPKLQGQLKMLEENIRRENNVISRFSHLTVQGDKNAMRSAGLMYGNPSTSSAAHSSTQRTPNRRTNWQDNNAGKVRVADGNQKMMVGGSSSMVVPYQRTAKKPVTVGRGASGSGQSSMIMAAIKAAAAKKKNTGGDAEIVTLDD